MYMVDYNQLAQQDFYEAKFTAFWRSLFSWLTRKCNHLLPLQQISLQRQNYLGLQAVGIDQIVGSEGRYHEFDRAFYPLQEYSRDRWVNIDIAYHQEKPLPPVELLKVGEMYFVRDGNHRVSVARAHGQEFIDAHVTELDPATPVEGWLRC